MDIKSPGYQSTRARVWILIFWFLSEFKKEEKTRKKQLCFENYVCFFSTLSQWREMKHRFHSPSNSSHLSFIVPKGGYLNSYSSSEGRGEREDQRETQITLKRGEKNFEWRGESNFFLFFFFFKELKRRHFNRGWFWTCTFWIYLIIVKRAYAFCQGNKSLPLPWAINPTVHVSNYAICWHLS